MGGPRGAMQCVTRAGRLFERPSSGAALDRGGRLGERADEEGHAAPLRLPGGELDHRRQRRDAVVKGLEVRLDELRERGLEAEELGEQVDLAERLARLGEAVARGQQELYEQGHVRQHVRQRLRLGFLRLLGRPCRDVEDRRGHREDLFVQVAAHAHEHLRLEVICALAEHARRRRRAARDGARLDDNHAVAELRHGQGAGGRCRLDRGPVRKLDLGRHVVDAAEFQRQDNGQDHRRHEVEVLQLQLTHLNAHRASACA
mmetsp:Transcript_23723/g.82053  ORF Transcript_23723/g.82053 Transcript_23723/m.82053 type:complete len:259 (-) Transcript_23723:68-844(-)